MDEEMGFGFDDFGWNDDGPDFRPPPIGNDFRNNRYNNAYGNYRGGYGPPGGIDPPPPPPPPLSLGFSPRPMFLWGRGFGPKGPPGGPLKRSAHEDKAIKYLMRCGVAKENLKNLPKEFLQHIEPHCCGICGQNFDSFTTSRIHYISKNHLKIQKRWLSKKSEMGPSNMHKEVPLRARELYCELCDVQITSRVHAESHYAGKPHRAVVEGRKYPKNPMLLQQNMRARMEQLIRREKKHLKNILEQNAESAKESKPVSSELYCDICKTSVTCTEQMTMHLNGKRHLNKEKQHILTMMKGGIPGNDDENSRNETETQSKEDAETVGDVDAETVGDVDAETVGDVDAETVGDVDAETVGDEGHEKDSFDWGNGSGNWDEPTPE